MRERISDLERVVDSLHDLAQRHVAQGEAYLRRAEAAEAVVRMRESKIAMMTDLLIRSKLAIARKEGYIDRVRENDTIAATPVRNPMPGELLDDVRDAMSQVDEATFDRMVTSMSEETLNKVLGKTSDQQSEFLR